jgi:predicted phosphate transport protein (TIGR00153 family)
MLGWFRTLMPREEKFFDLFEQHARIVVAGAEALRDMLEGGRAVAECYKTVYDRELDADRITREVLIAVRRTFITPFDRVDINDLITSMDDTIDQMLKAAKVVTLFEVRSFTPQMRQMADAIVTSAGLVNEAMPLLRSINSEAGRLSRISEQITHIEGQADETHDNGLRELYLANATSNPMAFITGNAIYDHLEEVVDRFDDVANEINSVVMDHV